MKKNPLTIVLGLTASAGLVGCFDDPDSDSSNNTSSYSVTAIDGYLRNASVWLDLNSNYVLDNGEPTATSGEGGVAELNVSGIDNPSQYPVVVQAIAGQTIDEDQGQVTESYVMSAPAGETAVTPLSTLVHNTLEQNSNLSKEDATQQVATQLGIDVDDVLGDFLEGDGAPKAAYAAEKIVELGALPEDPEDLKKATEQGSSEAGKFTIVVAGVNEEIKTILDAIDDQLTPEQIKEALNNTSEIVITDEDGDGVKDEDDEFLGNPDEWVDADGDSLGDNVEDLYPNDSDNDGYNNDVDLFPSDATKAGDLDSDGTDEIDDPYPNDTDNDGYSNDVDEFPDDDTRSGDDDNDSYDNLDDEYPTDPTRAGDSDGDNIDNIDDQYPNDTDNDSYDNDVDMYPNDNTRAGDDDDDGYDNLDDDYPNDDTRSGDLDNDGIDNLDDNCINTANADQADSDNDGVGDACATSIVLTWDSTNWDDSNWQ
ncbi:hypothetical protein LTQ03_17425 [Vibrio splendidus]|uniref:hypothetical protein n=1 Tax=Vibrio splendidus TaxID=29497 RepID=UPI001FB2EB48|nr:hypothetical protein [Vibrio splendidus]UOE82508.1 hypothetical protein LTQ03_17425 [Vibrio splendidus]